jgi:hypothetical protein
LASAAALALPGVASAAQQANAVQPNTNTADLVSATIVPDTPDTLRVCYDAPVKMPAGVVPLADGSWGVGTATGAAAMTLFDLRGYMNASNLNPLNAKVENSNPNCVRLRYLNLGPLIGLALNEFTLLESNSGAVQDTLNHNSLPRRPASTVPRSLRSLARSPVRTSSATRSTRTSTRSRSSSTSTLSA